MKYFTDKIENDTVSIIIPALNEEGGISITIASIPQAELQKMGYRVQILVIDGDSTDNTRKLAEEAGAEVIIERRRGYGQAFKTGFAHARGRIIATADADGTYPMGDIPKLVQILEKDNLEFITTDRFVLMDKNAMSLRNKIGNAILNLLIRILFRLKINDCQSGMWVFRKEILYKLVLRSNTPLSQEIKIEACCFTKCRWREIPIRYSPRLGKPRCGGWKVGFINLGDVVRKRLFR